MSEAQIQNKIIKWLREAHPGAVVWKIHEDAVFGVVGIPDIYFAWGSVSVWFEVKKPGGVRKKIQKSRVKQLRNNHIMAYFVESLDEVKEILCHYGS